MATEAQLAANRRYKRSGAVKQVNIKFYPADYDLLEYLDTKGGRASYIKRLIRKDMERSGE